MQSFTILDIGASGGAESHWHNFPLPVEVVGVEPDAAECERLNAIPNSRAKFHPYALAGAPGKRTLNISRNGQASSLYETNWPLVSRFPQAAPGEIIATHVLECVTLDGFLNSIDSPRIDFLKIDCEGAELEILQGSPAFMASDCLGISIEMFFQPYHDERPLFSDVDTFLRAHGFTLFDLHQVERWQRKTKATDKPDTWYGKGQVMFAQGIYLRDFIATPPVDSSRLRTMAFLAQHFGLEDYALELYPELPPRPKPPLMRRVRKALSPIRRALRF